MPGISNEMGITIGLLQLFKDQDLLRSLRNAKKIPNKRENQLEQNYIICSMSTAIGCFCVFHLTLFRLQWPKMNP